MSQVYTSSVAAPQTTAEAPKAEEGAGERPKWLPEKFKTAEEMAASYSELEKKLGANATANTQQQTQAEPAKTEAAKTDPASTSAQATPQQTADLSKYTEELSKNGKLADSSYSELEKLGYTRQVVDNYITGQKAVATQAAAEIHAVVGGEQNFKALLTWAEKGLSDAEKAVYNDAARRGDVPTVKLTLAAMQQKYTQQYGSDPKLAGGKGPAFSGGPQPFANWNQVAKAMGDPRYYDDESYRKEVESRLAISNV